MLNTAATVFVLIATLLALGASEETPTCSEGELLCGNRCYNPKEVSSRVLIGIVEVGNEAFIPV